MNGDDLPAPFRRLAIDLLEDAYRWLRRCHGSLAQERIEGLGCQIHALTVELPPEAHQAGDDGDPQTSGHVRRNIGGTIGDNLYLSHAHIKLSRRWPHPKR